MWTFDCAKDTPSTRRIQGERVVFRKRHNFPPGELGGVRNAAKQSPQGNADPGKSLRFPPSDPSRLSGVLLSTGFAINWFCFHYAFQCSTHGSSAGTGRLGCAKRSPGFLCPRDLAFELWRDCFW